MKMPNDIEVIKEPKIIQPREHRVQVSLWQDLSVNDLDVLEDIDAPEKIKSILTDILNIEDEENNHKSRILIDLYYYAIQFSRENNFKKEQTSAFVTMIKRTHEICIETPFDNVDHCFNHFREMLLCHSVKRPPYSIDLFSAEEVRKITEYVINTYFRHYKMYKYAFTPLVRLDLSIKYAGMPDTPPPSEAGDKEDLQIEEESEEHNASDVDHNEQQEKPEEEATVGRLYSSDEQNAEKELRAMIKAHLEAEIKKLRVSVDEQIKHSEETISKKITAAEGTKTLAPGKGRGGSGKSKKK